VVVHPTGGVLRWLKTRLVTKVFSMPENDSTPGTPRRKIKKTKPSGKVSVHREVRPPLIIAGRVYSRQDFLARMGISPATFAKWVSLGFRAPKPGTKQQLIISDDAIEFIRQHPDLTGEEDEA
jgi:hypothetical protein